MAYLLGSIMGGVVFVMLLSLLIEWAIVKRVMDDPAQGGVVSTVAAVLLAFAIVSMSSRGVTLGALIGYPVGGLAVVAYRLSRLRREPDPEPTDELEETFR